MEYLVTFLEGVISFLSPCVLPLLPVYLGYFAGTGGSGGRTAADGAEKRGRRPALPCAAAFVAGFTAVFCTLGVFAGTLGRLLIRYQGAVNVVCGGVVILLGLSFLEILPRFPFSGRGRAREVTGLFSAFVFGMVYAVSLTPCAGAFLGAALMLASSSGGTVRGGTLLLAYSLGLGLPFMLSALLMEQLREVFASVKRHYTALNRGAGVFLIGVGIAMAAGWLGRMMALLS